MCGEQRRQQSAQEVLKLANQQESRLEVTIMDTSRLMELPLTMEVLFQLEEQEDQEEVS